MTDLVQRMRARAAPEPNSINAMAEDLLAQAADRIEWSQQLDISRCDRINKLQARVHALEGILEKIVDDRTLLYKIKELARHGLESK